MAKIETGLHYPIKLDCLPSSWYVDYVGIFCQEIQSGFACGKHSDDQIGVPHLRPMNVSRRGELDFDVLKYVPTDFDQRRLSDGDVLFNNTNSPELIGKTAYVGQEGEGFAFSNHMTRLRFSEAINARFGAYQLHFLWMAKYFLHGCVKHVNQASVSAGELSKSVPLVAPPLAEQHRIVAKIEELFSELDQGVASLKTAREQLKVYRQSLLKNAFEGKLTAAWRAAHADQLETATALQQRIAHERQIRYQQQLADWQSAGQPGPKPKLPKPLPPLTAEELAELPELPEGWGWARLLEACEAVVDCHNKTAPYLPEGIPLVRTPSIRDMRLNFDDSIRYISQETYAHWSRRCPPLPGDILFTREAPMGEAALIPEGKMVCMGQRIMLLRPGKFISGKYLLCATQNPVFKKISDKVAVGTGVKHLRVGDVERLVFPICSQLEQQEIADQLDAKLSEADQLDQTLATALQQADALRQSILKKAFCGQLVKQDKNDEPATALLERIRAEQGTAKKSLGVRGRKPKSNMQNLHIALNDPEIPDGSFAGRQE